jgi:peptide/nickel transport system permease protein
VTIIDRPKDADPTSVVADVVTLPRRPHLLRRILRDKFAVAGLLILLLLVFTAIFAKFLAPFDPELLFTGGKFEGRSWSHWLGTDHLGRDNLSRIIFGTRVALRVALQVTLMTLVLSVPLGLLSGFIGGRFAGILMRMMDGIHSIPTLIMALTFATAFNHSFGWALFGISLSFTPTMTRLVRAETLSVREETYIEASHAIGTPLQRVLRKRVLHNVASPIIVQTSIYAGGAILVEAGLSILGVGVGGGKSAWGSMLRDAFDSIHSDAWSVVYPGAAIAIVVLAANMAGDGLRDALGLDASSRYGVRNRMGLTIARRGEIESSDTAEVGAATSPVLEVDGLTVSVQTASGSIDVIEDVSFSVGQGEILGLVGESGSGKTVTSLSITRLLSSPPFSITGGRVIFGGQDLLSVPMSTMRAIRGQDIGMIFQDPMAALNPSVSIGRQIGEAVRLHEGASRRVAERRALELLDRVGIPAARSRLSNYPHEFSGGMRQRVMIAVALSCSPKLLIADEPTTALDVTIQAQIIDLLRELRSDLGLSILLVTHDLGVVADACDRVLVMYAGQIVEQADVYDLFATPTHPYSSALLSAMPRITEPGKRLYAIPGTVPVGTMPDGCRFHPRCEHAIDACASGEVPLVDVGDSLARCLRTADLDLSGSTSEPLPPESDS